MRVLVTGANGYVGKNLIPDLLANGHHVVGVYRTGVTDIDLIADEASYHGVEWFQSDLSTPSLSEGLDGCEAVIHLASSLVTRSPETESITDYIEGNLIFTEQLLQASIAKQVKVFTLASSRCVYSEANRNPFLESEPTRPLNIYGVSKVASENLLYLLGQRAGMRCCSLRLAQLYGGEYDDRSLIARFKAMARKNDPIRVIGTGNSHKDFLHVHDACAAFTQTLIQEDATGPINIGSNTTNRILDIAEIINHVIGNTAGIDFAPGVDVDRPLYMDCGKAKLVLDWVARLSLEDGLLFDRSAG